MDCDPFAHLDLFVNEQTSQVDVDVSVHCESMMDEHTSDVDVVHGGPNGDGERAYTETVDDEEYKDGEEASVGDGEYKDPSHDFAGETASVDNEYVYSDDFNFDDSIDDSIAPRVPLPTKTPLPKKALIRKQKCRRTSRECIDDEEEKIEADAAESDNSVDSIAPRKKVGTQIPKRPLKTPKGL